MADALMANRIWMMDSPSTLCHQPQPLAMITKALLFAQRFRSGEHLRTRKGLVR